MAIDGIGASFGAFQAISLSAIDTVLITGLGPVGLGFGAEGHVILDSGLLSAEEKVVIEAWARDLRT
jgi:hypothetical protein